MDAPSTLGTGLLGLAAIVVPLRLIGCDACGGVVCPACRPALELRLTDADTGEPVTQATVVGADGYCQVEADLGWTSCEVTLGIGSHEVTVTAPGYEDLTITALINADSGDDCCSCGYNEKRRDEVMTPL